MWVWSFLSLLANLSLILWCVSIWWKLIFCYRLYSSLVFIQWRNILLALIRVIFLSLWKDILLVFMFTTGILPVNRHFVGCDVSYRSFLGLSSTTLPVAIQWPRQDSPNFLWKINKTPRKSSSSTALDMKVLMDFTYLPHFDDINV